MNNKEQPHTVLLFVCGGPCQLSSSKQCSVDLMFHLEQFIYSVMEKKPPDISVLDHHLINTVKC